MTERYETKLIEDCIKTLIEKFKECPRYFFSESDIKSYLYHLLISKESLKQEYSTKSGYLIGVVHTEYPVIKGFFDLVALDTQSVNQLSITKQKILCGIEIGLDQKYEHFMKDYSNFTPDAGNEVSLGYVLHFIKGYNADWAKVVEAVEEAARTNDCSLIKKVETDEVKALVVRIDLSK